MRPPPRAVRGSAPTGGVDAWHCCESRVESRGGVPRSILSAPRSIPIAGRGTRNIPRQGRAGESQSGSGSGEVEGLPVLDPLDGVRELGRHRDERRHLPTPETHRSHPPCLTAVGACVRIPYAQDLHPSHPSHPSLVRIVRETCTHQPALLCAHPRHPHQNLCASYGKRIGNTYWCYFVLPTERFGANAQQKLQHTKQNNSGHCLRVQQPLPQTGCSNPTDDATSSPHPRTQCAKQPVAAPSAEHALQPVDAACGDAANNLHALGEMRRCEVTSGCCARIGGGGTGAQRKGVASMRCG
jgi:hypothetical protein